MTSSAFDRARAYSSQRLVGLDQVALEAGARVGGLDQHNPDSGTPDLIVQGLGIAFHGMLAGCVQRGIRSRDQAHDRTDIDDASAALPPHRGKDGLRHADHPEQVDFEERFRLIQGRLFRTCEQPDAGVVHQQVDAARPRPALCPPRPRPTRRRSHRRSRIRHPSTCGRRPAIGAEHAIPGGLKRPSTRLSDTGRRTGDDGHGSTLLLLIGQPCLTSFRLKTDVKTVFRRRRQLSGCISRRRIGRRHLPR